MIDQHLNGDINSRDDSHGNFMDSNDPLRRFFIESLQKMKWAEESIISGLKKMQLAAGNLQLVEAFREHEIESHAHIGRIDAVFRSIGMQPAATICNVLQALLHESESIMEETPDQSFTRDAALIISAQKLEHHEIASYGGLRALAESLDLAEAADIFQKTLEEEKETDKKLTIIAEASINDEAAREFLHEKP